MERLGAYPACGYESSRTYAVHMSSHVCRISTTSYPAHMQFICMRRHALLCVIDRWFVPEVFNHSFEEVPVGMHVYINP